MDLIKDIFLSQEHADSNHYEKYIKTKKCYLINKEWMSEYKKYYLYDELCNYLNKKEIKEKLGIKHGQTKNYNDIMVMKIYEELKDNADFFKNYYNKNPIYIDEKLIEPRIINLWKKNEKKIKYYDDFVLINSDLKNILKFYYLIIITVIHFY